MAADKTRESELKALSLYNKATTHKEYYLITLYFLLAPQKSLRGRGEPTFWGADEMSGDIGWIIF